MKTTVESLWESYRAAVLPEGANRSWVRETRRAFYAGVYGALAAVAAVVETTPEGEAAAVDALEEMAAECEAFADLVKLGGD